MKPKDRMFAMLQDIITHFSENPDEKRCYKNVGKCLYNPPKTKPESIGCAIGMYIDTETAKKFDKLGSSGIKRVFLKYPDLLPSWMVVLPVEFLERCQTLHDVSNYWESKGLSKSGKEYVKFICKEQKLPFYKLKF